MKEAKKFLLMVAVFFACFYLPVELLPFRNAIFEALALVRWYAREHVLLCLVPAFFIAGAISVFISQASVIKYFGAKANKFLAYSVASISGTILAVCSCTVLPLFSGIYKRGAGLGPATAFLYSGPAINVIAIIMTARILGWKLGVARAVGAVVFSVVIGLLMHFIFIKEEHARKVEGELFAGEVKKTRALWQNGLYFFAMVGFIIFANWAKPQDGETGLWASIFVAKWYLAIRS
ncbi:MAG: permease, partial [Candidatus Omnitrophica bacterium]|nr:permease [Candidatus Omnitrophota bacterium]